MLNSPPRADDRPGGSGTRALACPTTAPGRGTTRLPQSRRDDVFPARAKPELGEDRRRDAAASWGNPWGDTVNTAARMEAHAEPDTIQVTERTYERLRTQFHFEPRGTIEVKGKGEMKTYVLIGPRASLRPPARA